MPNTQQLENFFKSSPDVRHEILKNITSCSLSTMKIIADKTTKNDNTIYSIENYYGNIERINIKYDESVFSSVTWIKPVSIFDRVKLSFNCKYNDNQESKQSKFILEILRTDEILIKDLIMLIVK
jgi:hypothetical protein